MLRRWALIGMLVVVMAVPGALVVGYPAGAKPANGQYPQASRATTMAAASKQSIAAKYHEALRACARRDKANRAKREKCDTVARQTYESQCVGGVNVRCGRPGERESPVPTGPAKPEETPPTTEAPPTTPTECATPALFQEAHEKAEPTPAEAERKAAAEADARKRLGELELPEGALEVKANPANGGWLSGAADVPGSGNLIDCHHWWTAPGEPKAVESFIEAHLPEGSSRWVSGSDTGPGGTDLVLGYRWPTVNEVLQSPTLTIQLVALPEGRTGVRADGMVVWLAPNTAADQIPAVVQVLELVVRVRNFKTAVSETSLSLTNTEAAKIEAIRSMIDSMPVNEVATHCKGPEPGAEAIFTFRAEIGGPVLAVATVPDPVEVEAGPCLPLELTFPGEKRGVLLENGPFIREVGALLGVKIYSGEA